MNRSHQRRLAPSGLGMTGPQPGHVMTSHRGGQMTNDRSSGEASVVNRIGLLDALRGLPFPAGTAELAEHVRHNDADEATINAIDRLDERRYGSAAEVANALSAGIPSSSAQGSAPHPGAPH